MNADALSGGFSDAAVQSARSFRVLLDVMACPGTILELETARPPKPLSPAAGTTLLTLADGTTPIFLAGPANCAAVRDWIAFHIGAPVLQPDMLSSSSPVDVRFAYGTYADLLPYLDSFHLGDPDYPDRSTTVLIELDHLANEGSVLSGPGIEHQARLSLPETALFKQNRQLFPLGLDFFLTCGSKIAALPRSTHVEKN